MTKRNSRLFTTWLPVALVMLAAALRFWGLGTQGLWDDEGITYGRIALPWRSMLRALPAEQMPLYYVGLKAWVALMGRSVFALRTFSVLPGVAMAPLLYYLGKRWLGAWAGGVAALCLVVAPASIYQAQMVRGYPWLALWALGAVALADQAPDGGRWATRAGYALVAAAALLTHLLAAPTLLALNLWVIVKHRRERNVLARWLPWQAVVLVPALVWVLWAGGTQGETLSTAGGNLPSLWEAGRDLISVAAVAPYDPTTWAQALAGSFFFALALLGLGSASWLRVQRESKSLAIYLAAFLWLIPFLFMYLLALWSDAPLYAYYWVPLTPWVYLGAAAGIQRAMAWRRETGLGLIILLVSILGGQLARYYGRTVEDLAPLAQRIASQASAGDAIVLSSIWRAECFKYYDKSGLPLYAEPDSEKSRQITEQHSRVWLLVFGRHPTTAITEGIIRQGFQVGRWTSGTTEMALYLNEALPQEAQNSLRATFGQEIELLGYAVQPDPAEAGAVVQVTLWWRAIATPKMAYKVFVHAVGPDGQIGGQQDGEPGEGTHPTNSWRPGDMVVDRHAVPITPGTMPGDYQLIVGLYDDISGQRLSIQRQGDGEAKDGALTLQILSVVTDAKPDISQLDIQHRLDLVLPDGLQLAGYDLHKLGRERSNTRFKRGDLAHLVLYWVTPQTPLAPHTWRLEMVDRQGRVMSRVEGGAEKQAAPGPSWPQDTLVTRQHDLAIPADVDLGEYDLFFTLHDSAGAMVISRQQLGPITVYPNITPTPAP